MIHQRQQMEGWGVRIIPRLAADLKNELPEVKGFSERNIGYMIRFAREYGVSPILQQPVAKLGGTDNRAEKVPQSVAQPFETKDIAIGQQTVGQREAQRPAHPPLVHEADHRTRLEQGCAGNDDQRQGS